MLRKFLFLIMIFSFATIAQISETQIQKYINEPYGHINNRRTGVADGNLVRTLFFNNGEVGQWPQSPSGEWPNGSGHNYLDGVAVLISAEVTAPGNGQIIHPLESSYREWMDRDPVTQDIWGLEPLPGYFGSADAPATNLDPTTWPLTWSRALPGVDENWDGYWYGYFGLGKHNADFETFFVMDDSQDKEFTRPPYDYFPIAADKNRGGLGLRTEVRGFQWSHVLAEDIIFWHYDIINLSDYKYDKTVFGFYTDTGVGGQSDNADDMANYDLDLDLAYAYDNDGFGAPGAWETGYYGYAYLESPGNALNGIDDDNDGVIDEKRDDGIDNDGDWVSFTDINGNGEWDANEPLNDDVGADGVSPLDSHYVAPDFGEGDGIPTPGEPNFDEKDKDESDMIGLTSLSIYRLGNEGTGGGWPKDDEAMWKKMNYQNFDTELQRANISMTFASGPFPLIKGGRERFSMALVFGSNLEDLVFNKETVQNIYNANYNFSKPPIKPTLTAVPGDKKVFLYWNDKAEESYDPFIRKHDFEGYLLYRSRVHSFEDIKVITDSKGEPKYWKPIAQFDLRDGIEGPDPVGVNGARFWRGKETGLQHSYIDEDVVNGERYYYALVSYDTGVEPTDSTGGLVPTECTKIIKEDFAGQVTDIDINCAVVVPQAAAAGFVPAGIEGDFENVSGLGSGKIRLEVLNQALVKDNAAYKLVFHSKLPFPVYKTDYYHIERNINGTIDTLIQGVYSEDFGLDKFSTAFDGMVAAVSNDDHIDVVPEETGWIDGDCSLNLRVVPDSTSAVLSLKWPADYQLRFADTNIDTTEYYKTPVNFTLINTTSNQKTPFELFDNDNSGDLTVGDHIIIMEPYKDRFKFAWRIYIDEPTSSGDVVPGEDDIFQIKTTRPFQGGDYFEFSTTSSRLDKTIAENELDKIAVVPNPYISTASWERKNIHQSGRGERKIQFINLPSVCTIRIYTVSGQLVTTLYKDSDLLDGALDWGLVTDDGMDIAYGLYVYHVEAPGIGEYIGKFAIVK